MSFTLNTFQFNRGVATCPTNGGGVGTVIHGYKSTDSLGTIIVPGYFPDNIDGSTDKVFAGDLLLIVASGTVTIHEITAVAPFTIGSDLFNGAGSPLVVAPPVAATDANALQVIGTTAQLEIADATHPGIVTIFDQVFTGIKQFISGVQFMTFGGTPATLNYYEEYTHNTTFTNGAEVSAAFNIKIIRIGSLVTIYNPSIITTAAQGAPGASFEMNTVLPARFRPPDFANAWCRVANGGVFKEGFIQVDPAGALHIFNDIDSVTPYTAAQISEVRRGSITYTIGF